MNPTKVFNLGKNADVILQQLDSNLENDSLNLFQMHLMTNKMSLIVSMSGQKQKNLKRSSSMTPLLKLKT